MASQFILSGVMGIAEATINRVLKLDPATLGKLRQLDGKLVHVQCTAPASDLFIQPCVDGVLLLSQSEAQPDTRISASATTLLGLLRTRDRQPALGNAGIEISGDMELAQQLQGVLAQLDIDWEAQLAEWLGDVPAHLLGNQLRSLFKWGQQTTHSMVLNIEEYLHEEARVLPPRAELEQFYRGIEALALDTDRLAARLDRLTDRLSSSRANREA